MAVKANDIASTYFFGKQPTFTIKGDYIYTYHDEKGVVGMSLQELYYNIIQHGVVVEE